MMNILRLRVCLPILGVCLLLGCALYYRPGSGDTTLIKADLNPAVFRAPGSIHVLPANTSNGASIPTSKALKETVPSKADDGTFDDFDAPMLKGTTHSTPVSTDYSGAMRCAHAALPGLKLFDPSKTPGADISGSALPSDMRIPHIIHQIWRSEFVHSSLADYIKSWPKHNPGWTHVLWTHESARAFTAKIFPQYLQMYDSYGADIYRADVVRYFILYTFGGVYMDLDIESLRPLDLVDRHSCFISQEPNVHQSLLHKRNTTMASNAFMGCRKGHPYFKYIIERLPEFASRTNDLLGSTGPLMLDRTYKDYFASHTRRSAEDDLLVAPGPYFQPSFDETNRGDLRKKCAMLTAPNLDASKCVEFLRLVHPSVLARQVNDCKELVAKGFDNSPEPYSYSDHHWVHSYWYPYKYHGKNSGVNVNYMDLVTGVIMGETLVKELAT